MGLETGLVGGVVGGVVVVAVVTAVVSSGAVAAPIMHLARRMQYD